MVPVITFVHGIPEIGGAERELLVILNRLQRDAYASRVIGPREGPFVEELHRRGIDTSAADFPAWRKLFAYPRRPTAVRHLRGVITAQPCSLIHVNDIWWVPQTRRAVKGLGIPIVAHVRQEIEPSKVSRYELERVGLVIAISEQVRRSLQMGGVRAERVRVVYSGIDCSTLSPDDCGQDERSRLGLPAQALVLGTVANLFARKGYEVMLRALPMILKSSPGVHYLIVGSGDAAYEARLRAIVKGLRLERRVHFAGFQDSVYPCLAAMDVYVHPALLEGFGIAVLEAMAMRKPVVATRTGGIPEIVQEGKTGILVPPGEPNQLAQAIVDLLQDSTRRVAMGKSARNRVETTFTVEAMMDNLIAAYRLLLGRETSLPSSVSV